MANTIRTVLYLDPDAVELLAGLAHPANRRGRYVSSLIRAAAGEGERWPVDRVNETIGRRVLEVVQQVKKEARSEGWAPEGWEPEEIEELSVG